MDTKHIDRVKQRQQQIKTFQLIAGIAGVGMVLIALFANELGLDHSPTFGNGEVLLFLAGLTLLLAGLLGRQIPTAYRTAAILLLNTLLLLAILELAAAIFLTFDILANPNNLMTHYLNLPYYAKQEWSAQFLNEHQAAVKRRYQPYTVWQTSAFTGQMINVDQNGIRYTPATNCTSDAYKVFTFGGSAMWGWGSPDWGTIPAYLQAKLQTIHGAQPVCVVNFSETAYVSTQGVIRLIQELKAENIPDIVIFYDGVNDVMAAHQTKQPGTHQSLNDIATRFKNPENPLVTWLKESNSAQLLGRVVDRFRSRSTSTNANIDVDIEPLAAATAEAYLANYKIVDALAQTYGFEYYFFWQPYILIGEKQLTDEEQDMITGLSWLLKMEPGLVGLFETTYKNIELQAAERENLYDIASAFDKEETQIWIDTWGHVTPVGNEIVAQTMIDKITSK